MEDNEQHKTKLDNLNEGSLDMQTLADIILDKDNNELLLSFLDTLPIGVTLQDFDGKVKYANKTAAQVHGYTSEEFVQPEIGREHIIAPVDREKIAAAISTIKVTKSIQDLLIRGRRKNGSEFYLLLNAGLIIDHAGKPVYCLILTRDVSDQEEMRQTEIKERNFNDALINSAALLSSSLNLDDVLDKILELAATVIEHNSANIMLIDNGIVHIVRAHGYKTKELQDFTMSFSTQVEDFSTIVQMRDTGLPLAVPDTRILPGWHTSPEFSWLLSYVGVPLRIKGEVIGVINLDSGTPGFFCLDDAIRFQAFADLAATAIANADLYEALQDRAEESSALFKAATALLSSSSDISTLAKQITQTVFQDFSTAHVAILLVDETSNKLVQIAQAGYESEQTHLLNLDEDIGLAASAIKEKKPIYVSDVNKDARFIKDSHLTQSEFDIPFIVDNQVIGVLNLESPDIDGFNEQARKIILTYAKRASLALENAKLIENLQKREFQMTLINRLTQISLRTSDLKEMLVNQVNILYETLSPDGVVVCFSHDTIRKLMPGYAIAMDDGINRMLNEIIADPGFSQKLASFNDVVVTDDKIHLSLTDSKAYNPLKAFILHPLFADGIHLGSAVMGYFTPRPFEKNEISFFTQVIDQIALAVAKNLSIMNAEIRAKEAENLREATATLTSTLNLQEVFERILETAVGAIPSAENGLLFIYDQQKQVFNVRAQFGFSDARIFTIQISGHEGMAGKVVNERQAQIFNDVSLDKISDSARHKHEIASQKSWIVAPLLQQNKIYGVIELCATDANVFFDSDLHVLTSFADTVTAAIQNAQLHTEVQQIAITDILTGLYNRRGFEELGQREIHRSIRTSAPLSLLLMDVDFLKQVNDTYGHSAGDHVLQEVADCCRHTFRQIDLVSRYGGDEFTILLPDTPIDHAREAAERLRRAIDAKTIVLQDTEIRLSASIGVACFDKNQKTISQLFDLADKALYRAKEKGRNSIVCSDDLKFEKKD